MSVFSKGTKAEMGTGARATAPGESDGTVLPKAFIRTLKGVRGSHRQRSDEFDPRC